MNKTKLRELLADLYKKRDAVSQEIDSMANDPREKKSKRYTKDIFALDLLTKRIVEIEVRLGDDKDQEIDKMETLFSLVEWAHKHQEEKKPLMTFEHHPPGNKRILMHTNSPELAEKELEELLEKKRQKLLGNLTNATKIPVKKIAKRFRQRRQRKG